MRPNVKHHLLWAVENYSWLRTEKRIQFVFTFIKFAIRNVYVFFLTSDILSWHSRFGWIMFFAHTRHRKHYFLFHHNNWNNSILNFHNYCRIFLLLELGWPRCLSFALAENNGAFSAIEIESNYVITTKSRRIRALIALRLSNVCVCSAAR